MFTSHEVSFDARFEVASVRLVHLINRGALHGVSQVAYDGGLEMLVRVGPFGGVYGLSKLVRVRVLDPVRRGVTLTVALRWEATGLGGELFPALDADLILMREGESRSMLGLVGSYRPPLGQAGVVLDRALMSRVTTATIRSLVDRVAAAIADPLPDSPPEPRTARGWRPFTQPEQP